MPKNIVPCFCIHGAFLLLYWRGRCGRRVRRYITGMHLFFCGTFPNRISAKKTSLPGNDLRFGCNMLHSPATAHQPNKELREAVLFIKAIKAIFKNLQIKFEFCLCGAIFPSKLLNNRNPRTKTDHTENY